jgi:cell division protein FtsQ
VTVPTRERPTDERAPAEHAPEEHAPEARATEERAVDERPVEEHAVDERPVREQRARPMIDPRIRERRIEVLREAGRRRLRVTLVIASTIVVIGLAYLAVHSPLLDLDHVRVTGSRRESVNEILNAAHVRTGAPLLLVDTGAIERRIERLPWVAQAHVKRDLPGTLRVEISEYSPTAFVRLSPAKVALVASTGRVIAFSHTRPPHALKIVGERVAAVGTRLEPRGISDLLRRLPPHLASRVGAVDVGGASIVLDLRTASPGGSTCRGVAGVVPGHEQIRLGTLDTIRDKGVAALSVLNQLANRPFAYIDVSVPQSPVSC